MFFSCTNFTAIAFILVSILKRSFGELIVLRHPSGDNDYERELTCLAEDDDSALIWNYNPTEEQLENGNNLPAFEPKRPTRRKITRCAVWGPGEKCLAGWEESNGWYAVDSTTKPMAPVLDHRWEGFTEFAFDKAMKEQNYLSVGKVDNSSGTVVFSVRGSYHTHVFLCKSNELTKGPCIWIALSRGPYSNPGIRFCAAGVPDPSQISLRRNCIDLATSQYESSEYLDAYEWRTFILKWDSTEKSIKIFTHDNSEPFLSATNSTWVDVPYIFVIGERPSRIRFHFYEYFLAERKDTELCTKELKNYREIVRFKLLVGLCRDCELIIILEDNMSREIYKKIVKNEISVTNELLAWRPVELTPNLGNLTSRGVRLVIRTIFTKANGEGRWAIDSFRTYETNGETRESTLTIGRATAGIGSYQPSWSLVKCQKLSYLKSAVVDPFSTAKFHDTSKLQEFLRGRKGPCKRDCTSLGPDWFICDQTGCTCDRGFEGLACHTSCTTGYYGYHCEEKCESCSNHICNQVTGYCSRGCKDSKLQPPLCKTELRIQDPFVTVITDTAATLFQPLEFDRGVNFTVGLEITNMESNTTRIVRPVTAESKSIFEVGIKLEPNTRYKLHTVVHASIGQWSGQVNSNEIFFTSTCMGKHRFRVSPGENYVTVTPLPRNMMCGDFENPIKSVTVSHPTGDKISCRHVIQGDSYICSRLSPENEYEIRIEVSNSTFWMMRFRTLGSAPDKPSILIPSPKGNGIVEVTWMYPAFNKTSVKLFRIHAVRLESKLQAITIPGTTERDYPVTEQKLSYSIDLELLPSTSYKVSVVAVNQHNVQSAESGSEIWVPAGVAFASGKKLEVKQSGTLIELEVPRVINATMNTTVSIVIQELSAHAQNQFQPSSTFANKTEWVAAKYTVEDSEPKHLIIDVNHNGGVASNFSLKIGGTFMILAIVKDLYSNSTGKLPPFTITLADVEPNLIWLIIFPIIAICLLALMIWHLKRKRVPKQPRQPSYVEPITISLELTGTDNNSTHPNTRERKPSIPRRPTYLEIIPPSPTTTAINDWPAPDITTSSPEPEATEDRSSDHVYIMPNEPDFCCVSMEDFAKYAKSAATSRRLHSQFMILHRILPSSPSEYGRLPENVPKNRDGKMPACDNSRVVLEKIPGDPHSDCINASYIKGYEKERAYIAAQGPKPNTVDDFWRMVWQEKVRVICMLTNVIEGGETKCEKYWPDVGTGSKYGDFHVSNTNNQVYADYTFRTFELIYKRNTRKVTHLHYTGWPDLGVPTYPRSLFDYLRKLEQTPDGNGPVVVHCSTGDDRTGTIILCAICLRQALAEKIIDVMAVTARMRDTRANMVGTLQQYVLAHVIITESLTSWPTQIPCADVLSNRMNKLRIQLPSDMKRLSDTTWQLQALQFSAAANLPTAKHSTNDENPELVQVSDRPEVIYDDVCEVERNQINAVSVDGVKTKKQYLACWLPSPFTLPKFWEFVIERDIKLIIILQCSDPRDPTCCDIMPSESIVVPLLKIEVENRTDRDTEEFFTNEKLRLTETSEANARSQFLTVLTCKGWGCGTIQKPPPPTALISLWRVSEKIPRKEGQTLVLCHDGVTGCGLYLAMSYLLERMAVERECDVISAIRAVRSSNPKFVQLTEQCEYLYDAAQAYAEYFQCYANFS